MSSAIESAVVPDRKVAGTSVGGDVVVGADGAIGFAGLSESEAAARLLRDGANVLPRRPPVRLWQRVLAQVRDPLIVVLLVAAALTVATGDWTDTAVILLVIVVNTVVGVGQEVRADHAVAALSRLTAPSARVVREERRQEIPAAGVVVGDLLILAEGDIVAADATLLEAAALTVDESALTGESVPVDKSVSGDSRISAGTAVVRGRGRAVVTATGTASATGRIAQLLTRRSDRTPLQRKLSDIGRLLAGVTVALCAVVLALGLVRDQPLELMLVAAISLAVAAVPESLPAVVTLGLALGARRMAERHAVIRELPAVETLGSVTVLATDKTGTLTEGRMVVRGLWTPAAEAAVTGSGYGPEGEILVAGRPVPDADLPAMIEVVSAAALCNDARLSSPVTDDDSWRALGDPTEAALLAAAAKLGVRADDLRARLPRVGERPFDSDRKRMTTVHRVPGGYRVICKGAPESVLEPTVLHGDPDLVRRAAERADRYAADGYRVLAVAARDRAAAPSDEENLEHDLRLLGLIAIHDPPRAAAAAALAACRRAGIRPVLVTGDHPGTARAIAAELGILAPGEPVIDCRDAHAEFGGATVYARATPAQKLDIIEALHAGGEIVAMTGDGVNDGPALRRADIGVAMGRRGTEVARQAADLVLADDNLDTVVAAVEEGRRVYANIRRFLIYGLSGGAAEIAVMLLGPFLGLALPLLPAQILWINLMTHGVPGVALGGEPAEPGSMRRAPRPPAQSILGAGLWQRVPRIALVLTAATLGVAVWAQHTGRPWQTMAFFALGATQLGVALGSRSRPRSWANPMLLVAVGAAFALQLAGVYLPPLRHLLGTEPLGLADLLLVSGASLLGYVTVRTDRRVHPAPDKRSAVVRSEISSAA
ncbi:cation-translocating P-type ATPase [Nocardia blacklockiae]|uniref:cation-translocating P-type ATPase n=1 Tax=Nocardia blacklockiae TaxID=480036 RepID=UPI0018936288|nr:cation-transporting P-type ATPase [Nocardia blacklockiae]MBF6176624.1 cation-transporting P-type ATPase [Nocardia blacklockiae]